MKALMKLIKQLLCKHDAVSLEYEEKTNLVTCHCHKCGKQKARLAGRFKEESGSSWL